MTRASFDVRVGDIDIVVGYEEDPEYYDGQFLISFDGSNGTRTMYPDEFRRLAKALNAAVEFAEQNGVRR